MARVGPIHARKGTVLPSWGLWPLDVKGNPVDYNGATITASIRQEQDGTTVTVTTGLTATGATGTGDGTGDNDIPSITVTRTSTALDSLNTGPAELIVITSSNPREHVFPMVIED